LLVSSFLSYSSFTIVVQDSHCIGIVHHDIMSYEYQQN